MDLFQATKSVLKQLTDVISQIREEDYTFTVDSLEATIGQHVRHIIEFYLCLFDGISYGKINYDERKRDKKIETDKNFALKLISQLNDKIEEINNNPDLILNIKYGDISNNDLVIRTNFDRELAYNIEHTIHHLAIIKTAFNEICQYVHLPENFGIASSTVRSRHS